MVGDYVKRLQFYSGVSLNRKQVLPESNLPEGRIDAYMVM
jgi:hypothetical protein